MTTADVASIRGYASLANVSKRKRCDITPAELQELCDRLLKAENEAAEQRRRAELYEPLVEALKTITDWFEYRRGNTDGMLRDAHKIEQARAILAKCEKEG